MPDTVLSDYNAATATTVATVGKERRRLFDFIRRRVRTDEDAEDILQDVFLQLTSSYNVTAPIEQLTSWLFTVARNRIIDWYRKKRPASFSGNEDPEEGPVNLEEILFDPGQHPDDIYDRSLFWRELADALDELPDEQREVFVMHELEGKSFKEIAEQTGEPVNTLLSRKRYAILHLRERLRELNEEI
ncbi:MAG TPA: RNA polymerase sigma factor [Bacteroidota bacterium]|nr:RNA polymerase sigma factor [Bacteroidota bacterium]